MNKKVYERLGYGVNEENVKKLIEFLGYEKQKIELNFDLKEVKEWIIVGEGLRLGKIDDNTIVLRSKDRSDKGTLVVYYIYKKR